MKTLRGTIFDIQHYSVHDGPGIRTTVFLKGCPLRCLWCSNPESQRGHPEIMFDLSRCTRCGRCIALCPHSASVKRGNEVLISRERCKGCGACTAQCTGGARQLTGRAVGVDEVMEEVLQDRPFYDNSGGGVTLSGGEPMYQSGFARALLKGCKERGIHTVLDTSGYVEVGLWDRVVPYVDMILFDLKEMDPVKHRAYTGVSNELILASARKLASHNIPMVIRIPLIPGYNDTAGTSEEYARFVEELGITAVELLPFHRLCSNKYTRLQQEWKLGEVSPPSRDCLEELQEIFAARGLSCTF